MVSSVMHDVEPYTSHGKGKENCEWKTLPQVRGKEHKCDVRRKEAGEKNGSFQIYLPAAASRPARLLEVVVDTAAQSSMKGRVTVEFQPGA